YFNYKLNVLIFGNLVLRINIKISKINRFYGFCINLICFFWVFLIICIFWFR
ncbi:hypothetical protein C1645_750224, partial [Glomus cerebriforme]